MRLPFLIYGLFLSVACDSRAAVQCEQSSNCDLSVGGVCKQVSTGNRWCAYPDGSCPSGYRYSIQATGDGVAGVCVPQELDAGIDAPADAVPSSPAASCVALPHTCGAAGNDDCCNSLLVIGGTYFRSYDARADGNSGDQLAPATISTFRLDKYEVTVGRFRAFVEGDRGTQLSPPAVGEGANVHVPGSGWQAAWNQNLVISKAALIASVKCNTKLQTWTDMPGNNENLPMNCVTWYEAMAFCAWDGAFLSTEGQWNYAGAGGDEQRVYAWSVPATSLTLDVSHASYDCLADGVAGCAGSDIVAVGTKSAGDGRWGHSDLTGGVMEWTLDWDDQYRTPCADCANIAIPTGERTIRGGSFDIDIARLRAGYRNTFPPGERAPENGIRCARAP